MEKEEEWVRSEGGQEGAVEEWRGEVLRGAGQDRLTEPQALHVLLSLVMLAPHLGQEL